MIPQLTFRNAIEPQVLAGPHRLFGTAGAMAHPELTMGIPCTDPLAIALLGGGFLLVLAWKRGV
jgi:hypothetical protein